MQNIHIQSDSGGIIADTTYEYDSRDNIVKKDFFDSQGNVYTEMFTYDPYNLLETAYCPDLYGTKTYAYAGNNNITIKDDRNYTYETYAEDKHLPHAVFRVKDNSGTILHTYQYDPNGNMTRAFNISKIIIRAKAASVGDRTPVM